ncbi:Chitin synthase, class 7 [Massospora cicadina]|nr:Chitin synthase, class 7 [Massospora cicadina]
MVQFGSYKELCQTAPLTVCPYVESSLGVDSICYARSMTVSGNKAVFEVASLIVYVLTLILCIFMIYSIKTKYTAIGRKEMVIFFYIYMLEVICEFLLASGIIPIWSVVYPYGAAVHVGLITACCWSLFLNGFVGFQFIEDGTAFSLWSIRLTTLGVFLSSGFVAVATFLEIAGLKRDATLPLFTIHLVFNGALLLIYYILQLVLVSKNLDDRWPVGSITFGAFFFAIGQVILLQFSSAICAQADHYFDGLFFEALCTLAATMMIYKYWDSITKEDLEFYIGGKPNQWEVKELLDED